MPYTKKSPIEIVLELDRSIKRSVWAAYELDTLSPELTIRMGILYRDLIAIQREFLELQVDIAIELKGRNDDKVG